MLIRNFCNQLPRFPLLSYRCIHLCSLFTDSQWIGARALAVVGVLSAICAFVMHIVISCLQLHRKWSTVLIEVCSLLLAGKYCYAFAFPITVLSCDFRSGFAI